MKDSEIRIEDKLGNVPFFIARCYEEIKKTSPHKHDDYYEIVYLVEGEGFHWIETEKYLISPPEFYFLEPVQLHHWQFTSVPRGYVILFKRSYFDDLYDSDLINLVMKLAGRYRTGLPPANTLRPIFDNILEEYSNNGDFSPKIIKGYLMALLAKILQITNAQDVQKLFPVSLYQRYQELVIKECPKLSKVKEFARLLHTTPQTLNAACRKQAGVSAKEIILDQLILESKRYLLHTEKTLTEIAYSMHFNDASYFVKFFKRRVGMSPLQFRRDTFH